MNTYARLFFRVVIFALIAGIIVVLGLLAKLAIVGGEPTVPRTYIERAYMDAEEAVKSDPKNARARVALAKAYIAVGRYNDAIDQASIGVRLDNKSMDAYMTLGIAYNKAGQYDNAIVALNKAINNGERGTAELQYQAYINLGQAYEAQGNMTKAVEAYSSAYDASSQDVNVGYLYAGALEKVGRIQDAINVYEDIVAYTPDDKKARDELIRLNAVLEAQKKEPAKKATAPATKNSK